MYVFFYSTDDYYDYIVSYIDECNTSMIVGGMIITKGKSIYSEKNLSQHYYFQHRSCMDWPGIEHGPLQGKDGN